MMDKRFGVTSEMPKGWVDIIDTDNNQTLCNIRIEYADNMIKLLNKLHEENNELKLQLNQCSDQRNEFHRGARENTHRARKLEKENEQLKKENTKWIVDYNGLNSEYEWLKDENEQLQKSLSASVEKNRKLQTILDKLGYIYVGDLK